MYPLIDPGTMLVIPGGQQPLTEKIFIVDRHLFEIWELDNIDGQCSVDITTSETIGDRFIYLAYSPPQFLHLLILLKVIKMI